MHPASMSLLNNSPQLSTSCRSPCVLSTANVRVQRVHRRHSTIVRAEGSSTEADDAKFEARLKAMKVAKGDTPYGESRKETPKTSSTSGSAAQNPDSYWEGEELYLETAPHRGDMAVNVALGATLVWLPLTAAAVGRGLFVKYRFTDRRLSVITEAPWSKERLDAAYSEVKDVVTVGRGVGAWGDMVVTLRNNDKIELRSLPQFLELKKYILQQRDTALSAGAQTKKTSPKGFA